MRRPGREKSALATRRAKNRRHEMKQAREIPHPLGGRFRLEMGFFYSFNV
jgi:hypothetical protein